MRISELPQEIKELALLRQQEEKEIFVFSKTADDLDDAFYWKDTEEGNDFWEYWDNKEVGTIEPKNYNEIITIIETKIDTMSSRGFESYYLPIGILKDLIREIKEIK
jgi:hypothetical protein